MGSKVGQDREGLRCLAKGLELVEPGKSTVGSMVQKGSLLIASLCQMGWQ